MKIFIPPIKKEMIVEESFQFYIPHNHSASSLAFMKVFNIPQQVDLQLLRQHLMENGYCYATWDTEKKFHGWNRYHYIYDNRYRYIYDNDANLLASPLAKTFIKGPDMLVTIPVDAVIYVVSYNIKSGYQGIVNFKWLKPTGKSKPPSLQFSLTLEEFNKIKVR